MIRRAKIEFSFKNVDREYLVMTDVPVETTDEELETGLQELRDMVSKAWTDKMTGYLTVGPDNMLVRLEELRTFKVTVEKED